MFEMLSAVDFAAVKVAIQLCNGSELKEEIFPAMNKHDDVSYIYNEWSENLEKKASILLDNLGLGVYLKEKVSNYVLCIGLKMLYWVNYHEGFLDVSRDINISILKSSLFTARGVINDKKAAEEWKKCQRLNVIQRYKLACLYCFAAQIPVLFNQMSKKNKKKFFNSRDPEKVEQHQLIKFWSYFSMGQVNQITEDQDVDEYLMKIAIETGSIAAIEYCLQNTKTRIKEETLQMAALMALKCRVGPVVGLNICMWNFKSSDFIQSSVPFYYYIDILCILLDKMTVEQKIEFLKKDLVIDEADDDFEDVSVPVISHVLYDFLNWPHQGYFMRIANMMWEFLSERDFTNLLGDICKEIEDDPNNRDLNYGVGKIYNYRKLLNQFWCESPQSYKRHFFINREPPEADKSEQTVGNDLILKIFSFKNFTNEDRKNIELILESATDEEKRDIIYSEDVQKFCHELIREEKWGRLNILASSYCSSLVPENVFKKAFSVSIKAQNICIDFIRNDKYNAAESFMKWSALTEQEVIELNGKMIHSDYGKNACKDLISKSGVNCVNTFCTWFISSNEELTGFKKELINSDFGKDMCHDLYLQTKFETVEELIRWSISSENELREFKKSFAYQLGSYICSEMFAPNEYGMRKISYDVYGKDVIGPLWEQIEMFLTWCFSSEEEIILFKKYLLLEGHASNIHFDLIIDNNWIEAETFFSWLGMSSGEIGNFKKNSIMANSYEIDVTLEEDYPHTYEAYPGGKWEKIELLLRWCLEDHQAILEFKNKFKDKYGLIILDDDNDDDDDIIERIEQNMMYYLIEELLKDYFLKSDKESSPLTEELPPAKRLKRTLQKTNKFS